MTENQFVGKQVQFAGFKVNWLSDCKLCHQFTIQSVQFQLVKSVTYSETFTDFTSQSSLFAFETNLCRRTNGILVLSLPGIRAHLFFNPDVQFWTLLLLLQRFLSASYILTLNCINSRKEWFPNWKLRNQLWHQFWANFRRLGSFRRGRCFEVGWFFLLRYIRYQQDGRDGSFKFFSRSEYLLQFETSSCFLFFSVLSLIVGPAVSKLDPSSPTERSKLFKNERWSLKSEAVAR